MTEGSFVMESEAPTGVRPLPSQKVKIRALYSLMVAFPRDASQVSEKNILGL